MRERFWEKEREKDRRRGRGKETTGSASYSLETRRRDLGKRGEGGQREDVGAELAHVKGPKGPF